MAASAEQGAAERANLFMSAASDAGGGFGIGGVDRGRHGAEQQVEHHEPPHGGPSTTTTPALMTSGGNPQAELWRRIQQVEAEKEQFKRHAQELSRSNELMNKELRVADADGSHDCHHAGAQWGRGRGTGSATTLRATTGPECSDEWRKGAEEEPAGRNQTRRPHHGGIGV